MQPHTEHMHTHEHTHAHARMRTQTRMHTWRACKGSVVTAYRPSAPQYRRPYRATSEQDHQATGHRCNGRVGLRIRRVLHTAFFFATTAAAAATATRGRLAALAADCREHSTAELGLEQSGRTGCAGQRCIAGADGPARSCEQLSGLRLRRTGACDMGWAGRSDQRRSACRTSSTMLC